ncbi:MAG: hypothetical protein OXL68_01230 [Paracoccaceae bacterium]|nr:hypothetical protein [Paracoccaceae bacterium]
MSTTSKPRTTEPTVNIALAQALRGKHPLWREHLGAEQTGVFRDHSGLKPDIVIRTPDMQPVVLETEFAPAHGVEDDAKGRLGLILTDAADPVEQAIAIRIPRTLRHGQDDLAERVAAAEYDYCLFFGDAAAPDRWPTAGWLTGSVDDIVRCIEHAMLSQRLIAESLQVLEQAVTTATRAIRDAEDLGFTGIEPKLGQILNQEPGEQTNRMAMTIVANALTFHSVIAGTHEVPTVAELRRYSGGHFQQPLLDCWDHILCNINYWPIFRVASDLLAPLRVETARRVLDVLTTAAARLAELGITSRHDLAGRMFQTLITDRKFLATFYTLPTSAALLAELAARQMGVDWTDRERYPKLTIADFSCGTGTLLSAAYQAVLARYRQAGGDDSQVHQAMIENAMIAADIMPAATHLCASQLSSAHPTVTFGNTRVYTMPYGNDGHIGTVIGSLELTARFSAMALFPTSQRQVGGGGDFENKDIMVAAESVDLVIMNPPFTRPTNHEATNVPVPSFAGFATSADEQRAMSARLKKIRQALKTGRRKPAGHGNAGLASNFVDLAHTKVKPGGVVAFVLPLASIQGSAWQDARMLFMDHYETITVVAIANSGSTERAFSADTGMAEALIVARR